MTYVGQKWIASMYDMDSTWGLWWTGASFVATDYDRSEYQDFKDGEGNLLYIRLEELFYEELQARWAELRSGALSIENIINRFERFTDIAPAELVKEDYASTTGDGAFTDIPSKTTSTIQQIRGYAVARHAWCDTYVAGLTPSEKVPCTGIALSASTLTFTEAGSQTLIATVEPTDTTDSIVWSVSPDGIATVSGGVVTAVANGSCTITATCGEQSATCAVSVSGIGADASDIDYTLNPLDGVEWHSGYGYGTTGVMSELSTQCCTDKFTLQGCRYNYVPVSGATYPALMVWDETGTLVGRFQNSNYTNIEFAANPEYTYALDMCVADGSGTTLMPVDNRDSAFETLSVPLAELTWTMAGNVSKYSADVSGIMSEAGISADAFFNGINKTNQFVFLKNLSGGTFRSDSVVNFCFIFSGNLCLELRTGSDIATLDAVQSWLADNNPVLVFN